MSEIQTITKANGSGPDLGDRTFETQLDSLKIITLTDGEVWSARDLMPYAGYKAWQDWSRAISRAIASVNASGLDAAEHFRGAPKTSPMPNGGTKQVEDVELTRYACYILFQNADARKQEVAAAQQYFAVKTRQAEVSAPLVMSDDEIVHRALQITAAKVQQLEARVSELEPRAAVADAFENTHGLTVTRFAQKYFPDYTRNQLFEFFYNVKKWLVNNPQGRWSDKQNRWIEGADHKQPKNGGGRYFHMPEETDRNGKPRFKLRVRRDTEHELVQVLEQNGFRPVLASRLNVDVEVYVRENKHLNTLGDVGE